MRLNRGEAEKAAPSLPFNAARERAIATRPRGISLLSLVPSVRPVARRSEPLWEMQMERHDSYQEMRPYTPGAVNSPFPDPTGEGYVGSVRKFAPTATAPANNVKRQPKPRTIRPRQASVRLVRMVIRFRRTMFGVLPLAWRVRAANDPEA